MVNSEFSIPFRVCNGLIIVRGKLNGKIKNFIFDSGCPTLILNSANIEHTAISTTEHTAMGLGGTVQLGQFTLNSFEFGEIKVQNAEVVTLPIDHLEKTLRLKIAGLIGFSLFRQYEITFDYFTESLHFRDGTLESKEGNKGSTRHQKKLVIPFKLVHHIPTFPVAINHKKYVVGLDCGATGNMLSAKHFNDASSNNNFGFGRKRIAKGAGSEKQSLNSGIIFHTFVGGVDFQDMQYAFDDNAIEQLNQNYQMHIDGLLGYHFLRQRITTLNYSKQEITIYL